MTAATAPAASAATAPAASAASPFADLSTLRRSVARWLEVAEFAIDNAPERVDALVELAGSLEDAWLALCEHEAAA